MQLCIGVFIALATGGCNGFSSLPSAIFVLKVVLAANKILVFFDKCCINMSENLSISSSNVGFESIVDVAIEAALLLSPSDDSRMKN